MSKDIVGSVGVLFTMIGAYFLLDVEPLLDGVARLFVITVVSGLLLIHIYVNAWAPYVLSKEAKNNG